MQTCHWTIAQASTPTIETLMTTMHLSLYLIQLLLLLLLLWWWLLLYKVVDFVNSNPGELCYLLGLNDRLICRLID